MLLRLSLFLVFVFLCRGGCLSEESLDHSSSRPPPPLPPPSRWQTVGSGRGPLGTLRASAPKIAGQADRLSPTVAGEQAPSLQRCVESTGTPSCAVDVAASAPGIAQATSEAGIMAGGWNGQPREVLLGVVGNEVANAVNEIYGMEDNASNEDMLEDATRSSADSRGGSLSPSSDEMAPYLSEAPDDVADASHLTPLPTSPSPGTHGAALSASWSEGAAASASISEDAAGAGWSGGAEVAALAQVS